MSRLGILGLMFFLVLFSLINFVSALNVNILSPNEGQTFSSSEEDILVRATIETESTCDIWGYVDTPNGRKDINPRECDICSKGSGGAYANSVTAYIDAVAGGNYEMHVTCRDRNNQMDSKIVNFQVEGNMAGDTTPPVITINFPTQGGNHYSNINLDFDVNELSSCRYSVSPQDYNGGSGNGFSGYLNGKTYETSLKQSTEYSLTVTCIDLMGNSASKTVSFTTKDRACESCAVPSDTTPSGSSGGGGGSGVPSGSGGGGVISNTSTTTYFKSCSYIWDSSSYAGQTIKITASIVDEKGNEDSDSVEVNIIEDDLGSMGGSGGAYFMDGKTLDIQITNPMSNTILAKALEIKISSKGPNELGDMSLGFSGENWGGGFKISNRNCIAGGSGGGGSGGGSTCIKYHTCNDGSEVQYCEIVKQYDENGEIVGAGCGCKANPESLCEPPSSGGGGGSEGGEPIEIPSIGGGGVGTNETPIICNGCILGDKCVPIGYRANEKYCDITSEFLEQKEANLQCDNNFECSTNLCIDSECISGNVWQKFLRFFKRMFGRD